MTPPEPPPPQNPLVAFVALALALAAQLMQSVVCGLVTGFGRAIGAAADDEDDV